MRLIVPAIRDQGGRWPNRGAISDVETFSGQVGASADDAWEIKSSGSVDITEGYARLGVDGTGAAIWSGFRIPNVTLSQGAAIPFAELRFTGRGSNSAEVNLRIYAEAIDSAPAFTTTTSDLSARTRTTAYVDWLAVPAWSTDQYDADTRSPDVAALVQEVVNRAGWLSGNAIVFLIEPHPVSGTAFVRRAQSYDYAPTNAPELIVNTTEGGGGPVAPTGSFTDGYDTFGVEGRNMVADGGDFDTTAPDLKDGTAFTSQMSTDYAGFMYWVANNRTNTGNYAALNYASKLSNVNSYEGARNGEKSFAPLTHVFRLTGDLRILDEMVYAHQGWRASALVVPYDGYNADDGHWQACGTDWSPDLKHLSFISGFWGYGTDINYFDTFKLIAMASEFTWMLWVNRAKTSPAGYNYQTEFDAMKPIIEGFANTWIGGTGTDGASDCWKQHYKGNQITSVRADAGEWPGIVDNGSHSAATAVLTQRYLGLLGLHASLSITDGQGAIDSAASLAASIATGNGFATQTHPTYGASLISSRDKWIAGDNNEASRAGYTGGIAWSMVSLWLAGKFRTSFTRDFLRKYAYSYAAMHYEGVTGWTNISTRTDILRGHIDAGATNENSWALGTSEQSVGSQVLNAFVYPLVFADGAALTKLQGIAREIQVSDAGGYAASKAPGLLACLFVQQALVAVEDL